MLHLFESYFKYCKEYIKEYMEQLSKVKKKNDVLRIETGFPKLNIQIIIDEHFKKFKVYDILIDGKHFIQGISSDDENHIISNDPKKEELNDAMNNLLKKLQEMISSP